MYRKKTYFNLACDIFSSYFCRTLFKKKRIVCLLILRKNRNKATFFFCKENTYQKGKKATFSLLKARKIPTQKGEHSCKLYRVVPITKRGNTGRVDVLFLF